MADILQIGAATVVKEDGTFTIPQATLYRPITEGDETDLEDFGSLPIACALGVTALPAATDTDTGIGAECVAIGGVGGLNGAAVSAWDVRCADVAGELSPGDTCLHGTHTDPTKRARFLCKENLASIIVGNDKVISIDGGGEDVNLQPPCITITAFGSIIQIAEDGIKISQGLPDGTQQCWIELKDGAVNIVGKTVIGGCGVPGPLVLSAGLITALGVMSAALKLAGDAPVLSAALGTMIETLTTSIGTSATTLQTIGT